ncbi:unnamed protein product, partial [Nesidiocoris tenuis]
MSGVRPSLPTAQIRQTEWTGYGRSARFGNRIFYGWRFEPSVGVSSLRAVGGLRLLREQIPEVIVRLTRPRILIVDIINFYYAAVGEESDNRRLLAVSPRFENFSDMFRLLLAFSLTAGAFGEIANINSAVDVLLEVGKTMLDALNGGKIVLPDLNHVTEHKLLGAVVFSGEFHASGGSLSDLRTIKRTGDVTLESK